MQLLGYKRDDGRVGFRNHVLVLPLTGCQVEVARRIAWGTPGATCLGHLNGCDLIGPDGDLFGAILEHIATHPNVGGVLFVAMGCAATLSLQLPRKARESGRLVEVLDAQKAGTTATVNAGVELVRAMAEQLAATSREPVPFSALTIGTKCGASDANSYSHLHPVVGRACDMLVERGATVVLSEDCEMVGGACDLAGRAAAPEIGARILRMAEQVNADWKARFGYSLEEASLQGQTRDEWIRYSLASAAKAGSTLIRGFFEMENIVKGPGLVILNATNSDLECVTALAASGCNVTIFTTGRGTPVGSPASITLKVTATQKTAERMPENIDLSAASVVDGTESLEVAARRLVQAVVDAANGKPTCSETLRHWEVGIPIRGVTY